MQTANYRGNVETIVGTSVTYPYLTRAGGFRSRTVVATGAEYDPATDRTRVEFDESGAN